MKIKRDNGWEKHFVNSEAQHKCLFIAIRICEMHQIKNNYFQ